MKPIHTRSDEELGELIRRAGALEDAPESAVRAAIGLWRAESVPSVGELVRGAIERIKAVLTVDSWATSGLALGVRSVPSDTRQLLFSAGGRDIDLRVSPAPGGFAISGQILGPDATGAVELVPAAEAGDTPAPAAVGQLDDLGEFHLSGVAAGRYTLLLRAPTAEIELPAFDVGERQR